VVVYDNLLRVFVSLDLPTCVAGIIRQFAVSRTSTGYRIFFITTKNRIYEAYAGAADLCRFYPGDINTGNPKQELKSNLVRVVMEESQENGTLSAQLYTNGLKDGILLSEPVDKVVTSGYPELFPFSGATTETSQSVSFYFPESRVGWRFGLFFAWNGGGVLTTVYYDGDMIERNVSIQQQSKIV